jgi:hypothetical protein
MRQSLMPDPQRAAIVRRLFKQYATGTYTKQEILQKATQWGLTNRRGQPLTSQAIGMLLRNRLYIGVLDVPEFGIRDQRGDFEPLISEEVFYKTQAVLSGKVADRTFHCADSCDMVCALAPLGLGPCELLT